MTLALERKKMHIITYGCQPNVYDSHIIRNLLKPLGYDENEENFDDADLIVLNTCNIREKAVEKVYSQLGRIKKNFENRAKKPIIVVAGCVAQAEGEEVFVRAPFVDVVVGPQAITSLPKMVEKVHSEDNNRQVDLNFAVEEKFDYLPEELHHKEFSAFVTVQEGCNKFCKFCVVPYTRGAEVSRKVEDVYRECLRLAEFGTKEIVFLGQNVNGYHGLDHEGNECSLGKLISHIAGIRGIEHIRYTSSHPIDMHDDLFLAHQNEKKLMPLLHLPVQSGSDRVLQAMNRHHTRQEYMDMITRIKKMNPEMQVSSDFIVGFPCETEQDFEDTLSLVRETNMIAGFSYEYSVRPGTPAALDTQFTRAEKNRRLVVLQKLLAKQCYEFNVSFEGQVIPVLLDKFNEKFKNQVSGRSKYMQVVNLEFAENEYDFFKNQVLGKILPVKILRGLNNCLMGKLVV